MPATDTRLVAGGAAFVDAETQMTDAEISARLLEYLRARTGRPGLAYAERPVRMTGGYDAAIFRFHLLDAPSPFGGPLVLRLFQSGGDRGRAQREGAVQNGLAAQNYPAPRVFAAEEDAAVLGGAFLIMERMPGRPLGSGFEGLSLRGFGQTLALLSQVTRIRRDLLQLWDVAQERLHGLPVAPFLAHLEGAGISPKTLSFGACFEDMGATVEDLGLRDLVPAIDWLGAHRPSDTDAHVICHGDFQPFNVLADASGLTGVIDWTKTITADPAFDYGAVIAILATVPIRAPAGLNRPLRALMTHLAHAHSRRFRRLHPGRENALRYYQVFNCAVQLIAVAKARAQGRQEAGAYNSAAGVTNLSNYLRRLTACVPTRRTGLGASVAPMIECPAAAPPCIGLHSEPAALIARTTRGTERGSLTTPM